MIKHVQQYLKLSLALFLLAASALAIGCVPKSQWKIQVGPKSCVKMCQSWDLEFAAMVGVGNQKETGDGATACVCKPATDDRADKAAIGVYAHPSPR